LGKGTGFFDGNPPGFAIPLFYPVICRMLSILKRFVK